MSDDAIKRNDWLSRIAEDESLPNFTSQRGEDRILRKIFDIIGANSKWAVEFGAADGKRGSNTWQFITQEGWSAVEIEPRRDEHMAINEKRDTFDSLCNQYREYKNVICLNTFVQHQGAHSLDAILSKTSAPGTLDLVSIDVDGDEYRIWESIKEYRPRVVVIEHNKTIPIELDIASDKGSSIRALARLGKEKGYELVAATIVNAVFVEKREFSKFGIANNDPEQIWPEHKDFRSYVYQLTDGTVVMQGNNKLRWTRGYDGTIDGQIKSGNYVWIKPKVRRLFHDFRAISLKAKPTGVARAIIHKIASRV